MANPLKALFQDQADAIREGLGDIGKIAPADFPARTREIVALIGSGGGSSEDVKYVTFMNEDGTEELFKKAVIAGDDCPDVVAKGLMDTPTKESTDQYNFTYMGWARTPNGGLDETALEAITEDRVLYANFASVLRYYTVRFYDGETLVDTVSVSYGSTAVTKYEKANHTLIAWNPSNENITGDTDCYGEWEENLMIADDWATVSANADAYNIGMKKAVTFSYDDETSEVINFTIVDKNVDVTSDGSIAVLTFMADNAVKDATVAGSSYNNQNMNILECVEMEAFLGKLKSALPEDLQSVMLSVAKFHYAFSGGTDYAEGLFLPSVQHIKGTIVTSSSIPDMCKPLEHQYQYFADGNSVIRTTQNGTAVVYWTATQYGAAGSNRRFCLINNVGQYSSQYGTNTAYVVPCFCVGVAASA